MKKCYQDILNFQKMFFSENIHFPVTWFELLAETIMIRNILIKLFNLSVLMDNQSNRSEADFDFVANQINQKKRAKVSMVNLLKI